MKVFLLLVQVLKLLFSIWWCRPPDSVTRFGEFSPLWQYLINFGQCFESLFCIWKTLEPTLTNFKCHWANFHWCKRPNAEILSSYLVALPLSLSKNKMQTQKSWGRLRSVQINFLLPATRLRLVQQCLGSCDLQVVKSQSR